MGTSDLSMADTLCHFMVGGHKRPLVRYLRSFYTVKILKFGTPQTIAIIVLKIEMFDVRLH